MAAAACRRLDVPCHVADLARLGDGVDADVIAFCGVHFMAETASIL